MSATVLDLVCHACSPRAAMTDRAGRALDTVALCNAAHALGSALWARGVQHGDRVACALAGDAELLTALVGTAAAGAALVPLASEPAVDAMVNVAGARVLLVSSVSTRGAERSTPRFSVLSLAFDDRGALLVDGHQVYESSPPAADPDDAALVDGDGVTLTHRDLVEAAGERGLGGLIEAIRAAQRRTEARAA